MMYTLIKTIKQRTVTFIAVMVFLLGATDTWAGEITGVNWFSGVASVAGETVYSPTAPNNDNMSGPSSNLISVLQKDYFAIGPVDLVFDVINPAVSKSVYNTWRRIPMHQAMNQKPYCEKTNRI